MPTAKVQIFLCIHAVWSGYSLVVDIYNNIQQYPLILLAGNEGPDQPAIGVYVIRKLNMDLFRAFRINY